MDYILGSQRKDHVYLIFSVFAGLFIVGFYYALIKFLAIQPEIASLVTFIPFAVLFDVRHFFPTYMRTLFDGEFMSENKKWFIGSWVFILLLPIAFIVILSSSTYRSFDSHVLISILLRFTYIMGFYHLIKQNWGVMAIYKSKYGESNNADRWEKALLMSGSFFPFIVVSMTDHVWFSGGQYAFAPNSNELEYIMNLWSSVSITFLIMAGFFLFIGYFMNVIPQFKYVSRNLGLFFSFLFILFNLIKVNGANQIIFILAVITAIVFLISLFQTIRLNFKNGFKSKEKWLILISTILLYNLILFLPIENKLVVIMAITLPHNIQYLAFTRSFNQKYYQANTKKAGITGILVQKFSFYLISSFLFALIFEFFRTGSRMLPVDADSESLLFWKSIIAAFFVGMVLHHYFLDAIIWRVRKDVTLNSKL